MSMLGTQAATTHSHGGHSVLGTRLPWCAFGMGSAAVSLAAGGNVDGVQGCFSKRVRVGWGACG